MPTIAAPRRHAQSAIIRTHGGPFTIENVTLDAGPQPDEVIIHVVAAGMCHTDLMVRDDRPATLPVIVGHEGACVVEDVDTNVHTIAELKFCCHRGDGFRSHPGP